MISPDAFWEALQINDGDKPIFKDLVYGTDNSSSSIAGGQLFISGSFSNWLNHLKPLVAGVHKPYTYFGQPNTVFAAHTEDFYCYSANILMYGAPKVLNYSSFHISTVSI